MVIVTAMIPTVRNPTGTLSLDLNGRGTWLAPQLTGRLTVHDGGMTIPSLGSQRYGPINGSARFVADSMVIDSLQVGTGESGLRVKGGMRFEQLAKPRLDLEINATQFSGDRRSRRPDAASDRRHAPERSAAAAGPDR